jgi:ATP phosphoribosyltransferase regulatory subunit HisZ
MQDATKEELKDGSRDVRERRSRDAIVRELREVFRRFGYEGATLTHF